MSNQPSNFKIGQVHEALGQFKIKSQNDFSLKCMTQDPITNQTASSTNFENKNIFPGKTSVMFSTSKNNKWLAANGEVVQLQGIEIRDLWIM